MEHGVDIPPPLLPLVKLVNRGREDSTLTFGYAGTISEIHKEIFDVIGILVG